MGEIKREPCIILDENGDEAVIFDKDHTWSDIARWIISERGRDEVLYFLEKNLEEENGI